MKRKFAFLLILSALTFTGCQSRAEKYADICSEAADKYDERYDKTGNEYYIDKQLDMLNRAILFRKYEIAKLRGSNVDFDTIEHEVEVCKRALIEMPY